MAGNVNVLVGNITTGITAAGSGDAWVLTRDSGIYASFGLGNAAGAVRQRFLIEGTILTFGNGVEAGTGGLNQLTVTATGVVQAGDYGLRADGSAGRNTVVNAGLVTASQIGIRVSGAESDILNTGTVEARYFGISVSSTFTDLAQPGATIVNSGQIVAATAIIASGGRNTVTNDGTIAGGNVSTVLGAGYGIRVGGDDNTVANNGTVSGAAHGIGAFGSDNTVTNTGRIEATSTGIRIGEGDRNTVVNSGEISVGMPPSGFDLGGRAGVVFEGITAGLSGTFRNSGTVWSASGTAVSGGNGDEKIVNNGILGGSVVLGNGDDRLVNRGDIAGIVSLRAGNDVLRSFSGTIDGDILGGPGNDLIRVTGTTVTGLIKGGSGDDIYVIDQEELGNRQIRENFGEGYDIIRSHVGIRLPQNVEQLELLGAADLSAEGNPGNNFITGNLGANVLAGLDGDDVLRTGGGSGNLLLGGPGNDWLESNWGDNTLRGGAGNDYFRAILGDNRLFGGSGDDRFELGEGAAQVFGGAGTDEVSFVLASLGVIVNLAANRKNAGGAEGARLKGIENLSGSNFDDRLTGDGGDNILQGGLGDDLLRGGDGNDTLIADAGHDVLRGGAGADSFRFKLSPIQNGIDAGSLILDFVRGTDVIDLSAIDANRNVAGDQAFVFIGNAAFSGTAGELRFFQKGGDTRFEIDVNGDGVLDLFVTLRGLVALTADDFIL